MKGVREQLPFVSQEEINDLPKQLICLMAWDSRADVPSFVKPCLQLTLDPKREGLFPSREALSWVHTSTQRYGFGELGTIIRNFKVNFEEHHKSVSNP